MALAAPPPAPTAVKPLTAADLSREYVASSALGWYQAALRSLPWAVDDLTADFGTDLYERMLKDAQVAACMAVLKASILEDGVRLSPAVDEADDPRMTAAQAIADAATAMLTDLETPLDDALWNMLDAIALGHCTAELKWALKPGPDGLDLLQLAALKPKPLHSTAFVVDPFLNVLGLLALIPGKTFAVQAGSVLTLSPALLDTFVPREKFAVLTFRPRHGDPRGTSLLRPAYDPWWRKRQVLVEYVKYLAQFAGPSLIGFTAPEAQAVPATDSNGNVLDDVLVSPEELMMTALTALHNGTAAAFPNGASVQPLASQGDGAAFLAALQHCDQQIVIALLTQTLATNEGQHQARAAAEVHQDVLDTLVRQAKRSVQRMLERDILQPFVRYNFGPAALLLTPTVTLGSTEQRQQPALITALATAYSAGLFAPDQLPALDTIMNVPVRDLTLGPAVVPAPTSTAPGTDATAPATNATPTTPTTPAAEAA